MDLQCRAHTPTLGPRSPLGWEKSVRHPASGARGCQPGQEYAPLTSCCSRDPGTSSRNSRCSGGALRYGFFAGAALVILGGEAGSSSCCGEARKEQAQRCGQEASGLKEKGQ